MEKTKLLTITVIGLLLVNLATLSFLFLSGPKPGKLPHKGRPEPREIIIEKLHFDAKQQQEYDKLIQWHRDEIEYLDDTIRHKKYLLYTFLYRDSTDVKIKERKQGILNELSYWQQRYHWNH